MINKKFKGYLVLNWKTGEMKIYKKGYKELKQFEVALELNLDVEIPNNPIPVASGTITLSEQQVSKLTVDSLDPGDEE